jgi:hypothetical protein
LGREYVLLLRAEAHVEEKLRTSGASASIAVFEVGDLERPLALEKHRKSRKGIAKEQLEAALSNQKSAPTNSAEQKKGSRRFSRRSIGPGSPSKGAELFNMTRQEKTYDETEVITISGEEPGYLQEVAWIEAPGLKFRHKYVRNPCQWERGNPERNILNGKSQIAGFRVVDQPFGVGGRKLRVGRVRIRIRNNSSFRRV